MSTNWHAKYGVCHWMLVKNCHSLNILRDERHNGDSVEENRNYRYFPHVVSIFFPVVPLVVSFFFLLQRYFTNAISFLPYGDLTLRIRYSIGRVVVNLIEHKGFDIRRMQYAIEWPIQSNPRMLSTALRRGDRFLISFIHCFSILALWFLLVLSYIFILN